MTDIPIIFSAPMVRALLEGRKTTTRRLAWQFKTLPAVKPDGGFTNLRGWECFSSKGDGMETWRRHSPWQKVKAGDRLYVRENFSGPHEWSSIPPAGWGWDTMRRPALWYWADGDPDHGDWTKPRPSIHMPRWASRLTLVITGTKVEKLQDIGEADAIAEGIENLEDGSVTPAWRCYLPGPKGQDAWACAPESFRTLWISLHGRDGWHANPDVVALSFRVEKINIDAMEAGHHDPHFKPCETCFNPKDLPSP